MSNKWLECSISYHWIQIAIFFIWCPSHSTNTNIQPKSTNSRKFIRLPSLAIRKTSLGPPTIIVPLITIAIWPANMMNNWIVSAHRTAFMPPCNITRQTVWPMSRWIYFTIRIKIISIISLPTLRWPKQLKPFIMDEKGQHNNCRGFKIGRKWIWP